MTTEDLYDKLQNVSHSRDHRKEYAELIITNLDLIPKLLEIVFMVDDKVSCRASWVLEFVCGAHLEALLPHLDTFTEQIHKVHLDPAVRPVAKVCEHLITAYYSPEDNLIKELMSQSHKEKMVEACFDWLINDEKVAPKAYSMNSLFLLGTDFDWVHQELATILVRDFQLQSSGFKARARHILKKIGKNYFME